VSEPQVSVDHFSHRPVCIVVGLLTDSAGIDVAAVEILCGEAGARILDARGRYHGLRGRVARTLQGFGYDLDDLRRALGKGDLLLHVPARPADSSRIAALLQRHGVHDLGCCGPGAFEQFPSSMRADPGLTRNSRPFRRLMRPGPRAVPAAFPSGGHPHDWPSCTVQPALLVTRANNVPRRPWRPAARRGRTRQQAP
jgi:hypothetical protein